MSLRGNLFQSLEGCDVNLLSKCVCRWQ